MIAETIRDKLEKVPFEPFVLRASSRKAYRVADPALVVMMKSKVFVAEPKSDRATTIPYLHITAVEESSNGHAGRSTRTKRKR